MPASSVQTLKSTLVTVTSLSLDALHIYVGLGAFFLTALVFKKPLRSLLPWLAVVAIAAIGELTDMRDDLATFHRWRWADSLHDLVNTIFWPTAIMILCRLKWIRTQV